MTLPRFFALTVSLLTALAAGVLLLALGTASRAVVTLGDAARTATAAHIATALEQELGLGERAIADFEEAEQAGAVVARDPEGLRRYLLAEVIALDGLTDLTLTAARFENYDPEGAAVLAAAGRAQTMATRDATGKVSAQSAPFPAERAGSPGDPTLHDTFRTAAHRNWRGAAIWSDIAYSAFDAALPEAQRRKTLTIQKAIFDPGGTFVGVLRAGIVSDTLERMGGHGPGQVLGATPAASDPHRIFITDTAGRLVTRLGPLDRYQPLDTAGLPDPDNGDLRVTPAALPPAVGAALAFARAGGTGGTRRVLNGEAYLITLLPLAEGRAQQWLVGVVVPERFYVGDLARARDRLLALLLFVVVAIAVAGALGARTVGVGLSSLLRSTEAMRQFRFAPLPRALTTAAGPFREIRGALESVERAKTALRAMVKYVPIGLVRRLYESGHEPTLGAEPCEVSIMFTDIADFTTHAEALAPMALAAALGRYLETATAAVEATGGIVDKYIGDALMVLWNVPSPVASHPHAACRAALDCARATRALGQSAWWTTAGLPPFATRFGVHADRVLVGNFGAPDRLSYTAMGDGVNLAARLEGLNKLYGTTILVSEAIHAAVGAAFVFREVDRVAVKGKTRAITIHELRGEADSEARGREAVVETYEAALHAAHARDFAGALALLGRSECTVDGPSGVLAGRCRKWAAVPPPEDWDGTWIATTK